MNRNQFISYVDSPDKLSGNDSVLLSELLKNFPYFQTAQLLYAKSLHNEQSVHYNNQLKITAAYATDRKVLHQLITKQDSPSVDVVEKPIASLPVEVVSKEEDVPAKLEPEESIVAPETIEEKGEPKTEKLVDEVAHQVEFEEKVLLPEEEKEDAPVDELEKEYLSQVAIASIELEVLNSEPQIEDKKEEKGSSFVLNTPAEEFEEPVVSLSGNGFDDSKPHSFLDWLKHSSETVEEFESQEVKEKAILPKQTTGDLVDTFLKETPRLSKPKVEFYNPVNMAKQSVADDITFVSETLAKIFMMQGNHIKALEAYEILRLKYPEKRLYFASQIKKLRKLIN